MSPRSEEFLNEARERLAAARALLERELLPSAVSAAYYAMLYSARAALSEQDRFARTHSGTWQLMREEFVFSGALDEELVRLAQKTQSRREYSDYQAGGFERRETAEIVSDAGRFVAAIEALVDAPGSAPRGRRGG